MTEEEDTLSVVMSDFFYDFNNNKYDTNDSIDGYIRNVLNKSLDPSALAQDDNCDDENEEENSTVNNNETAQIIVRKKRKIIRIKFAKIMKTIGKIF